MSASASIPVVSAPPPAPTTQLFNPNADPDFVAYRKFHNRPIELMIKQILDNPDNVQMLSLFLRVQAASDAEIAIIAPYIADIERKNPLSRSAAESLILYCRYHKVRVLIAAADAKPGTMFAHTLLAIDHNLGMFAWRPVVARNNPQALLASATGLINIIMQRSYAERLSEEELQLQFRNLQDAASLGEPRANQFLARFYCSEESDFKELSHIVKKPFQIPNKQLAYKHYREALKNGLIGGDDFFTLALELELFGEAACIFRFEIEISPHRLSYFPSPLEKALDHPEVIYHVGTLIDKFNNDPKYPPIQSVIEVFQKIKEGFNNLASTQPALFLQLLSRETEPDQTRIFNLLSESAKQFINQYKDHPPLSAQPNALTARVDTVSLAASPFSHWTGANAKASAGHDMKRDAQGRVVTAKPTPGKTG